MDGVRTSSFEPTPRPLSADDIRKAKQRAYFLNSSKVQKPLPNNSKRNILSNLGVSTFNSSDLQNLGSCSDQGQLLEGVSGNVSSSLYIPSGELRPALKDDLMEKSSFMNVTVANADLLDSKISDVKSDQDTGQVSDVKLELDNGPQIAQIENVSGSEVRDLEEPNFKSSEVRDLEEPNFKSSDVRDLEEPNFKNGSSFTAKQLRVPTFPESTLIHWVEPPSIISSIQDILLLEPCIVLEVLVY